jgi:hypothetical protein
MRIGVAPQFATHWLPCGKCLGCRDTQAAAWTLRLRHESRLHSHSTFLTATYDAEHEPPGLQVRDMQLFWKRLRMALPNKIKTFYCGEYGDRTKRPHYHAAVFGLQPFPDEKRWDMENKESATLTALWGNGRILKSELTPHRMAYVAGYVLKKAGYKKQLYCDEDGVELEAPFRKMSNGLGKGWLMKYATDLRQGWAKDEDRKIGVPRYYLDRLKKDRPELAQQIQEAKDKRREEMEPPDRERSKAAEQIREQKVKQRKREKI